MAFPFVFPGAYSLPQILTTAAYGWIHSPNPEVTSARRPHRRGDLPGNANGTTLDYLQNINHNPLDTGDNLRIPANPSGHTDLVGFPDLARDALSLLG